MIVSCVFWSWFLEEVLVYLSNPPILDLILGLRFALFLFLLLFLLMFPVDSFIPAYTSCDPHNRADRIRQRVDIYHLM